MMAFHGRKINKENIVNDSLGLSDRAEALEIALAVVARALKAILDDKKEWRSRLAECEVRLKRLETMLGERRDGSPKEPWATFAISEDELREMAERLVEQINRRSE